MQVTTQFLRRTNAVAREVPAPSVSAIRRGPRNGVGDVDRTHTQPSSSSRPLSATTERTVTPCSGCSGTNKRFA